MAHVTQKIEFPGALGTNLSGRLHIPEGDTKAYALFAHCFTCSKDITAASRICKGLAELGISTLRFDFTGIGESAGDFADTSFSSNVADLKAAAGWLREHHDAPCLIIGHSLGGAAVLLAAGEIPEVKAVVTVAAPSDPAHLQHTLHLDPEEVAQQGEVQMKIAGRDFTITSNFLQDLEKQNVLQHARDLNKALLIFHSPQDETVSADHAKLIYGAAQHPKSFISLDGADHLLTKAADADYVAHVINAWAARYLDLHVPFEKAHPKLERGEVFVRGDHAGFMQDIFTATHHFHADEPTSAGGTDLGAAPHELVLAGLGACTSMTLRMYAQRKEWVVEEIDVKLSLEKIDAAECAECQSKEGKVTVIRRAIRIVSGLDEEQIARLLEIADKCPVHRTLTGEVLVKTERLD